MKIIADFVDNGFIPCQYTCDGEDRFPTLTIIDIPAEAKFFVLVVDDPDAPGGTWDHLLLANIPLSENGSLIISQDTFDVAVVGQNSWGNLGRGGPCPPSGTHRYFFKLYAFAMPLDITSGFSKERLYELMEGKILAQTQLVGLYKRQ